MRKFFSFRSSSSASGHRNSNPDPPAPDNEKVYWEAPLGDNAKYTACLKVEGRNSQSPKELAHKPLEQYPKSQDSSGPRLRRSLSFSSPARYGCLGEGNLDSLSEQTSSPCIYSGAPCQQLLTPERLPKTRRHDQAAVRKTHSFEKLDSPTSSLGCHGSSPYSSPVQLKCRAARMTQVTNKNKTLDLYIDGEQQERKHSRNDDGLSENRILPNTGRPPRAQFTAPSSPIYSKENLKSYSFREGKDICHHFSTRDWLRDDTRHASPHRCTKKTIGELSHAFPGKSKIKPQNYASETTATSEELIENSSDPQTSFNSNGSSQDSALSIHTDPCQTVKNDFPDAGFQKQSDFLENMAIKHEISQSLGQQDEDMDRDLLRKAKEVKERFMLPDSDIEPKKLLKGNICLSALVNKIRNISEDRNNLALELSSQIQCRISERFSAKEALKQAKVDLDTRTRRMEKEKNELQSSLEKELDRRSSDWSLKLEKFKEEEQRLRERTRELAEQNVSLQREISSLNGREVESRNRVMTSEKQMNDLTMRIEEVREENQNLHQDLSELQEHSCGAEADLDCIRKSYQEKEKENKDLQKAAVRLQRICNEQEKTIVGLRQSFCHEIEKQSTEKSDHVSRLEIEQVRLTGVEQILRREVESYRLEVESLRHENICLLDRLQSTGSGCVSSLFRLDQELRSRIDFLQNQGFSLFDDNCDLCAKLLEFVKGKQHEHGKEVNGELDVYMVMDYNKKFQSLKRGIENLKRSLQTSSMILDEKSGMETFGCQSPSAEGRVSRQWKSHPSEDEMKLELKAEVLLTSMLREKLCSKELELEQQQALLASSIRGHDILRSEIQRLQDQISCLAHKAKDVELQMLKKDDNFKHLQCDLQECMNELTIKRDVLPKVSEERDHLWEEVKQCKETNMQLNYQASILKKKVEALEEDNLLKEGQITILKDSLGNKTLDFLYSPNSMKDFAFDEL